MTTVEVLEKFKYECEFWRFALGLKDWIFEYAIRDLPDAYAQFEYSEPNRVAWLTINATPSNVWTEHTIINVAFHEVFEVALMPISNVYRLTKDREVLIKLFEGERHSLIHRVESMLLEWRETQDV